MGITYEQAVKKARYGHRNWIIYQPKGSEEVAEPATAEALKRAMLAVGTKGRFTLLAASTAIGHRVTWRLAVTLLRNARMGAI